MQFSGIAKNGLIQWDRPADLKLAIHSLEGKQVIAELRGAKAKRSIEQNARYWSLLQCASEELGYDDKQDLHEALGFKFLPAEMREDGLQRRRSTATLSVPEFADYEQRCERFLRMDLNLDLSDFDREYSWPDGVR